MSQLVPPSFLGKLSFRRNVPLLVLFCSVTLSIQAQVVVTRWNFNSVPPDNNTSTGTTTPSQGTGTASLAGGTTATFASGTVNGGSTDPASSDNSAWNVTTFPPQGTGNATAGAQFLVSTSGYQNIIVSWDCRHSNTSSRFQQFQYTTNGGTTWTSFGSPFVGNLGDTWFNSRAVDLSSVTAVNNNAQFGFRIVAVFDPVSGTQYAGSSGSYGATGTWRFDMVTVSGTCIPATITGDTLVNCTTPTTTLTASNGASYIWSNSATTSSITVGEGSYSVTVTSANGCTASASVLVDFDTNSYNTYYFDQDGDGFGDGTISIQACTAPPGFVVNGTDCDDADDTVYPNAPELCDFLDNDCDGVADDGLPQFTYYADADGDGYGDPNVTTQTCFNNAPPQGFVMDNTDCDDTDLDINPAASEVCNGLDDDCDGLVDEVALTASITPNIAVLTCSTTSIVLTASGGPTFDWSNNSTSQTITVSSIGTYTVTVTDVSTSCQSIASITVTEDVVPPSASISGNTTVDCTTPTTTLTASGGVSYAWSNNATTASITVGAGSYTVTVTGANGCTASASETVTGDFTAPNASISGNTTVDCTTPTTTLTASGGVSYAWSNNATTASITVGAGSYTVTVTGANGCTATQTTTVTFVPPTVVITTTGNTQFCVGTPISTPMSLTVTPGSVVISRQWRRNGLNIAGAVGVSFTATTAGTYNCLVVTTCGTFLSNSIVVTQLPAVVPVVSPSGTVSVCAPNSVTLTGAPGAGSPAGPYQWRWVRSNTVSGVYTNVPGGTNPSLTTNVAGYYRVEITFPNGCKRLSDVVRVKVDECANLAQAPAGGTVAMVQERLKASPNPTMGAVRLSYTGAEKHSQLLLFDALGRVVADYTPQLQVVAGEQQLDVDMSRLPSGVYFVRLVTGAEVTTLPLVRAE